MSKLLIKLNHYIRKKIFKNLKYEFEEFIPNSMSTSKDTHNLIKININQFSSNLLNVYNYFGKTKIVNINTLKVNLTLQERIKQLLENNGSDKTKHGYHILYSKILNNLPPNPTILEIGIGTTNKSIPSNMGRDGVPGASLKAFSDYFPNSQIYGADVDTEILKDFKNVKTFYINQNDISTYQNEIIDKKNFDLIIDDGLHMQSANLNTVNFALERLKPGGMLIIEDITSSALNTWFIVEGLLREPYKLSLYECFDNYAVTIELKKQII